MKTAASDGVAALKATPRPSFLRVKENDAEVINQIAVPDVKRWKGKVASILEGMPWSWIEPLDSKGNIIGPRVDNTAMSEPATELEEFTAVASSTAASSELATLAGLLSLMLKAQDTALTRQSQAYSVVLDNNAKLLDTVASRLSAMEGHAQKSFEVISALHNRLNIEIHENGGGDDDDLDGLAKEVFSSVVKDKLGLGDADE